MKRYLVRCNNYILRIKKYVYCILKLKRNYIKYFFNCEIGDLSGLSIIKIKNLKAVLIINYYNKFLLTSSFLLLFVIYLLH